MLAHAGRIASADERAEEALERCAAHPAIFTDSSMVTDMSVLVAVLKAFGFERVLYGSDEPFSLLRYRNVRTPEGGALAVAAHPYHWQTQDRSRRFGHLAIGVPMVHFQSLRALLEAIHEETVRTQRQATKVIENAFHDDAAKLL